MYRRREAKVGYSKSNGVPLAEKLTGNIPHSRNLSYYQNFQGALRLLPFMTWYMIEVYRLIRQQKNRKIVQTCTWPSGKIQINPSSYVNHIKWLEEPISRSSPRNVGSFQKIRYIIITNANFWNFGANFISIILYFKCFSFENRYADAIIL